MPYIVQHSDLIGSYTLVATDESLIALHFGVVHPLEVEEGENFVIRETEAQLRAYEAGTLSTFNLPLSVEGTPFQRSVWEALRKIPYGITKSYADIAREIGNPRSVRAVAQACHRNPIGIIIPCHRVIGSNGSLTGFGGGLSLKRALLQHESKEETLFQD